MATLPEAFDAAVQHHRAGRREAAEQVCQQILAIDPACWQALHLAGIIARELGRNEIAAGYLARAAAASPSIAALHRDLGEACMTLRRFGDAVLAYQRALALEPSADAHNGLGVAWHSVGNIEQATACFERALQLSPNNAAGHNNLGILYRNQGKWEPAIACYRRALALQPGLVQAWNNLANVLLELGQRDDAIACCRRALELQPAFLDARVTLGNCLKDQGNLDEAIACYQHVLNQNASLAPVHNNLGAAFKDQGRLDEAIASFRRAMELQPDIPAYHSNLVYTLNFHSGYDARSIFEEHLRWSRRHAGPVERFLEHPNDRNPDRRLRLGYLSPDFRSHSVGRFLMPLLERHDHARFEVFCYSTVRKPDTVTERCRAHADVWRNVTGQSDDQIAGCIRSDRIDILVDLAMHMENNRLLVFARRPAPVQVTWLAYCGTTGLDTIDYRLTDPYLDPADGDESCYSERSLRLPETYWCYQPIPAPEVGPVPALSSGRITFGCLNNFCKVTPAALAAWARILQAIPGSRLLLHARTGSHRDRVRDYFASEGVSPERLTFADWVHVTDYFRLYSEVDVALDSIPHGGGTTTCDALWMGVPVVTLAGSTAVSRSGFSLLSNLGLSEFVAFDPHQYAQIAVELAGNLPRLASLRSTLRERMKSSPLMDAGRYANNVEAAYRLMWQRWCVDQAGR